MRLSREQFNALIAKHPGLLGGGGAPVRAPMPAPQPAPESALAQLQVPTDEAKLNKTERTYLAFIRCLGFAWIGVQNVTLKLADDCRLTPDFTIVEASGFIRVVDTKAFNKKAGKPLIKDDALVKLKCCARMFPWMQVQIAYCVNGIWTHKIIKP